MTHPPRRFLLPAVAIAAVLALAGCASAGADVAASPTGDAVVEGGSATYAYPAEATTLDLLGIRDFSNSSANGGRALAIYDALFTIDADTGALVPRIAASIEASADGTEQTLKLNPGVQFSDGTPYDAEAVKFNWERMADPANNSFNGAFVRMASDLKVVDDTTLTFTVTPASTQFGLIIARYFPGVGSPTAIKSEGAAFGEKPVGAGAFMVESWVHDSQINLVKNPKYWQKGLPHLDSLTMKFVQDPQQRFQSVSTGEVDIADLMNAFASQAESAGLGNYTWKNTGGTWFGMNENKAPFNDPEAVDALRASIDRDKFAVSTAGPGAVGNSTFFREGTPYFSDKGTFPDYDPKGTQKALDAWAKKNGGPLTFSIFAPETARTNAEALQVQLASYENISVSLEIVPTADYLPRTLTGDWQTATFGAIFVNPYPELAQLLHTGSSRNFSGVSNKELDAALDAAAIASSEDELKSEYETVQDIAATELPYVMLGSINSVTLYGTQLQNVGFVNDTVPDWAQMSISQ